VNEDGCVSDGTVHLCMCVPVLSSNGEQFPQSVCLCGQRLTERLESPAVKHEMRLKWTQRDNKISLLDF